MEITMTLADLGSLGPLIILFVAPVLLLMIIAFYRRHGVVVAVTLASFAASFIVLIAQAGGPPARVTDLLIVDSYSRFYVGLILLAAIAVVALSHSYLESITLRREEYYVLLMTATLGAAVLVESCHFASLFLGLEILGVSLYGLIGYQYDRDFSVEAAMKYLVLAAVSSAFLLFGMALLYWVTGSLEFSGVVRWARYVQPMFLVGICALIVGFGFKLALVPFHMWTPDVYQGAPAPVTAFVASVSKGAVFALVLRYFTDINLSGYYALVTVFTVIALLSMWVGNLLALMQSNVKRLLAYSSIAHLGYLLVAFVAAGPLAYVAIGYYLVAYFVTIVGAFGVVSVISGPTGVAEDISNYRGLGWRRPWLAAVFTATLLSLAGLPLTAGFIGKFFLVTAGLGSALWVLVTNLVVTSVVGLYYYIRVIYVLYETSDVKAGTAHPMQRISILAGVTLAALAVVLVIAGLYPSPIINIIGNTAAAIR
jgi:NADH-quinone oxidoreductase subunit N